MATRQPPAAGSQQQNAPRQQPRPNNRQSARQQQRHHHQGVLWKRRDVFKNKWRPRWFVLQPEEAVLTYYLLSKNDGAAAASTISTPLRRSSNSNIGAITTTTASSSPTNTGGPPAPTQEEATNANTIITNAANNNTIVNNNVNHSTHSNVSELTTDLRSIVSENPVDYEVVPRGAIYLPGCRVGANDALSVPSQGLYVLTIVPPGASSSSNNNNNNNNKDNTHCHLAARTGEARAVWVEKLRRAAFVPAPRVASTQTMTNNNNSNNTNIGNTENNRDTNNANDDLNEAADDTSWKSISPQQTLFDNVPETLAARIEQTLENHLEHCDDDYDDDDYNDPNPTTISTHPRNHHHWKPIFEHRQEGNTRNNNNNNNNNSDTAGIITASSAYQRQDLQGRTLLKSTAIIPHHPKQVLSLLLDSQRRPDFEANVAHSERLQILNSHTFLDYYAYKAVWPTSPRDFAVVVHWQALQRRRRRRQDGATNSHNNNNNNNKDEALVTLAFSCSEAEELKDPSSTVPHVRAKLHASFYLLRLIPPNISTTSSTPRCHLTRILSLDLGGALPRNLQQAVLMQQAGLPGVLSRHLQQAEPTPAPNLSTHEGLMSNDTVLQDVLHPILQQENDDTLSSSRRRLDFDNNANESGPGTTMSKVENPFGAPGSNGGPHTELSLPSTAAILLLPVLVHHLFSTWGLPLLLQLSERVGYVVHPAIIFCITAFLAVRYVVVGSLGSEMQQQQRMAEHMVDGPTTCTLSVDLKKVQRYIGAKRERGKDGSTSNGSAAVASNEADISVLHVVATALTKAMQKHATCWNYRRVTLPLLFVDDYYRYPSPKLTMSVSASGRLLTLEDFQFNNVQAVANALSAAEKRLKMDDAQTVGLISSLCRSLSMLFGFPTGQPRHGRCLIVLTKVASNADNQLSSSSDVSGVEIAQCQLPDDLDVLVVVGGIRLHRSTPTKTLPPKPILSLSLTINTASVLDVAKCNAFAEDLQKFIQFPELCDD